MAQYKCLECGHIVSISAKKCLNCGAPNYANFPNMILQEDGSLKHIDLFDQPCFLCGKMLSPKSNRILRFPREGKIAYWWCPECYERTEREYCRGESEQNEAVEVIAKWIALLVVVFVLLIWFFFFK